MRRVRRMPLDQTVEADLQARQAEVDQKRQQTAFCVTDEWRMARQTETLRAVLATLKHMMGDRERCMYCLDSHGTDIEHFWPKTPYPERMFVWLNLLLCCAECGRFKGDRFPLSNGLPLLVDPTAEDPWTHLDFDPLTGNVVARFDPDRNDYSAKGIETVRLLQLDRREALAVGHRRTFRRLSNVIEKALSQPQPPANELIAALRETDDHGLLGWCFLGSGQNETPFSNLRVKHPLVWDACVRSIREQ